MAYNPKKIEAKWQEYWLKNKTFKAEIDPKKEKLYCLDMFPYPSGNGLHVGHPEGYTATDIYCRYKRMKGFNVLHTMGWDAFGLPAEQYAVKTGVHPTKTTEKNIATFKKQIQALGFSYDWDREINTTDPDYYKWTQWIFLKIFEKGLAYQEEAPVNWCPELKAVLSHEEVADGLSVEGGHPVYQKNLRQWKLKITAYAEALLKDLEELDWPEPIKEQQRNWIGKSQGVTAKFYLQQNLDSFFEVYTTRADTLFGATYCVLAPEHPLIEKITIPEKKEAVEKYLEQSQVKSERERISEQKEKTGVFTGAYAINPANNQEIPIWVSDYVLISYGTGAIMAVPAHDKRDYEFAQKFGLEIKEVVAGGDISKEAYSGDGKIINSDFLNGLNSKEAIQKITEHLEQKKIGKKETHYKLRDWLFSRQRYWGEPIPVIFDEQDNPIAIDEKELPLLLPETDSFTPLDNGESRLAAIDDWINFEKEGKNYSRESNTMPQWAGSCWYFLRFVDPQNKNQAWSKEAEQYWMPVDLYVGGAEHAVLHLLYARFWHKVLYDYGLVHTREPFQKLINQGMILGSDGQKMSKSRGNVVNPDEIVAQFGADSLRLYEMFMGPLEKVKPWQTNGVDGVFRFLNRVWNMIIDREDKLDSSIQEILASEEDKKLLHRSIKKISEDLETMHLNTAISEMMIFVNQFSKNKVKPLEIVRDFILILSPFAPHLAEELWQMIGEKESLAYHPWPTYDKKYLIQENYILPVQINGKMRFQLEVQQGENQESLLKKIKQEEKLEKYLKGKEIKKVIFVPNKIVNLVV